MTTEIRFCPKCASIINDTDGRTDCYRCINCDSKFTIEEYGN